MKHEFNPKKAAKLRDEAIAKGEANAKESWKKAASAAIAQVAMLYDTFTTDEVWMRLGKSSDSTHDPRAMGSIMRNAQKQGIIAPTTLWRNSARVSCHKRPSRVWKSLIRNAAKTTALPKPGKESH